MSFQINLEEDRRVSSFRIDDILAAPQRSRAETSRSANAGSLNVLPSQHHPLTFGVDRILATHTPERKNPNGCCGTHEHIGCHSTIWNLPYLGTQSYMCGSLPHSGCEACLNHAYYMNSGLSGMYGDYSRHLLSKPTIQTPALPGQPKPRKPRRPWTRAVFSNLQRKGLEKRFQVQKYLTKGDRHQLAAMLGLSDNQVKVWFQNRRMKWRQEARETVTQGTGSEDTEKKE